MRKIKKKLIYLSTIVLLIILIVSIIIVNQKISKKEVETENEVEAIEEITIISTYDNPIVPEGFHKVETDSASWEIEDGTPKGWNNGLVIEDEIGNQFVWIPVKDKNSNLTFKNYKYKEIEKDEQQIAKYGGFYIARYEAGIPNDMSYDINNLDTQGIPVSKKNAIAWDYITLKNALANSQNMYKDSKTVESSLITVDEWSCILKWLSESGYDINESTKYGNFVDTILKFTGYYSLDYGKSFKYVDNGKKGFEIMLLSTGASEQCKTNNIYDLVGNLVEFTNSFNEARGYYSVGGHFCELARDDWYSPRTIGDKTPLEKLGFRVVLYNK